MIEMNTTTTLDRKLRHEINNEPTETYTKRILMKQDYAFKMALKREILAGTETLAGVLGRVGKRVKRK